MNRKTRPAVKALLLIVSALVAVIGVGYFVGLQEAGYTLGASALGMGLLMKDALLSVTHILPAGALSITSGAIDLGHGDRGDWLATIEFKLSAPALLVGQLANASTVTYDIIMGDTSDLTSSPTTIYPGVIVQTGAGGAGDIAATKTVRLPIDTKQYVGFKATKTGAASAAAASATLEALC